MPYYVTALGIELSVNEADPREVQRVEGWLADLEDHTHTTLQELLESCQQQAPTVGISILAQGEEGEYCMFRASRGRVSIDDATPDERKRLRRSSMAYVGKPKPSTKPDPTAPARAAIAANDVPAMMKCFDELRGTAGGAMRAQLAEVLASRDRPEAYELFLRALRDDVHAVAHAIAFRLHNQKQLQPRVLAIVDELARDLPRTLVPFTRFTGAIREYWADFVVPPEFLARHTPAVRAALGHPDPAPPRSRADAVEDALRRLATGDTSEYRKAMRNLAELKPEMQAKLHAQFASRLTELASSGKDDIRGYAIDLLDALGADIKPFVHGLPALGRIRTLRGEPVSPARLVDIPAPVATPGLLAVVRDVVTCTIDGKRRWVFEGAPNPRVVHELGESRGVVYVSSKWGLHALDLATGSERWIATHVDLGEFHDDVPRLWNRDRDVLVRGQSALFVVDRATGAVRDAIEPPFPMWGGFVARDNAVLVRDGCWLDTRLHHDAYIDRGCIVRADGTTEDLLVPRCFASLVREAGGVRADFTATDVVIRGQRFALPPGVRRIGQVAKLPDGTYGVPLFIEPPGNVIYGAGSWRALTLC